MSRRDRFEVVTRLRRLAEDRALAERARAERATDAAAEDVEGARALLAGSAARGEDLPPEHLLSLQLRGLRQAELVDLASEEYARTLEVRTTAHRALRRARQERESVERLASRRQASRARAARTRAERSLDELALLARDRESRP